MDCSKYTPPAIYELASSVPENLLINRKILNNFFNFPTDSHYISQDVFFIIANTVSRYRNDSIFFFNLPQ